MSRSKPTDFFTGGFGFLERLSRLPDGIQRVIAAVFCEAVFLGSRHLRGALLSNLETACPDQTAAQHFRTAHRIMQNYGTYFRDLLRVVGTPSVIEPDTFFDELSGFEHIETALNAENGGLLVTPHLGNWELGSLVLNRYRNRLAAVTAPIKSEGMRQRMEAFRTRYGVELVTLNQPAEYLFILKRLLSERKLVILLVDRYVGGHSMPTPFFGHETVMPCGYLYLARMFDAPVVPCYILRKPNGRYSCRAETPVYVAHTADRENDITQALRDVMSGIESEIKNHITQWYCFHPVWK